MRLKLILGLLYYITSVVAQYEEDQPPSPSELPQTCPPDANFCFTVEHQTTHFRFTLLGKPNVGYMAIGLGTDMSDSHMMIGWFDTKNRPRVVYRKGVGHDQPAKSGDAKVKVLRSESDFKDRKIIFDYTPKSKMVEKESSFPMIWAFSSVKPTAKGVQRHETRGGLTYSLADGANPAAPAGPSSTALWHGILMMIAWLILPTAAIFIARFMKDIMGVWWFRAHFSLFGLTGIIAIIAIVIMAAKVGNALQDPHSAIGVVVMVLFGAQVALGIYSDQNWTSGRLGIPWQDRAHWWLGRLTFTLAVINIVIGIVLVGNPSSLWIPFLLMIAVTISLFTYGSIKLGKVNH